MRNTEIERTTQIFDWEELDRVLFKSKHWKGMAYCLSFSDGGG